MRRTFILGILLLTAARASHARDTAGRPALPDGHELIARAIKQHGSLKSYADSGTVLFEAPGIIDRHTFKTFYRAPRNFYFEFTADKKTGGHRYVLWCDGGDFQSWSSALGTHEKYPRGTGTATTGFTSAAWPTKRAVIQIPSMLFGNDSLMGTLQELAEPSTEKVEELDGRKTWKVTGVARSVYGATGRVTNVRRVSVWLDAETLLVRRIFEDTPEGTAAGQYSRLTTTYDPKMNVPLPDERFRFTPPQQK